MCCLSHTNVSGWANTAVDATSVGSCTKLGCISPNSRMFSGNGFLNKAQVSTCFVVIHLFLLSV
jgi:hypothetical protein